MKPNSDKQRYRSAALLTSFIAVMIRRALSYIAQRQAVNSSNQWKGSDR